MIKTTIELKEEIDYEVEGKVYEITCPDGFRAQIRRTMSNGCIEMQLYAHLGARVEELIETKRRTRISIPGVKIFLTEKKNTIAFISDNKPMAMNIWNTQLRPFLVETGLAYHKPDCLPYVPKKLLSDCFDDPAILKTQ